MYHEGFRDGVWYVDTWDDPCALVATVHGLFICNRKTNAISRLVFPPISGLDLDTVFVSSLFWETPRRLWIGTLYHGLYLFDRASGSLTAYHKRPAMRAERETTTYKAFREIEAADCGLTATHMIFLLLNSLIHPQASTGTIYSLPLGPANRTTQGCQSIAQGYSGYPRLMTGCTSCRLLRSDSPGTH